MVDLKMFVIAKNSFFVKEMNDYFISWLLCHWIWESEQKKA